MRKPEDDDTVGTKPISRFFATREHPPQRVPNNDETGVRASEPIPNLGAAEGRPDLGR
jgi:hypothetical protein